MKVPQFSRLAVVAAVFVLGSILPTSHSNAESSRVRTIKFVVPFPPGSPADILTRLLANEIGPAQGLTMIVENHPGAGGAIGTEAAARALPDGNTLVSVSPAFLIDPHLRKLGYDPLKSFEPICNLASSPTMVVVRSASPYRTLADLLEAARGKPGVLTLAGIGPASNVHIAFEMLKRAAKVDMSFVPYPGPGPAVSALLGEHVTSVFVPYAAVAEQLKAGELRALATSSPTRVKALPDVPTVAESGYRNDEMDVWFGVVAPAKTPKQMVSQLADWFTAAMQIPDLEAKLALQGLYPVATCGDDFAAFLRKQYDQYGRAIRDSNVVKAE
jgi:tripartite-type tricarboxylate transporter receptor subunit TctC